MDEVPKIVGLHNFTLYGIIANGGFGTIYKAVFLNRPQHYALKQMRKSRTLRPDALLERFIMTKSKSQFLVQAKFAFEDRRNFYLAIDIMKCDASYLRNVTVDQFGYITGQVMNAFKFLHRHHIIHRDCKPANLLVSFENRVLLTDFGGCIRLQDGETSLTSGMYYGTPGYMPPEVYIGKNVVYTCESDSWGFAVTMFEILTEEMFFKDSNGPDDKHRKDFVCDPKYVTGRLERILDIHVRAFLAQFLTQNQEDREPLINPKLIPEQFKKLQKLPQSQINLEHPLDFKPFPAVMQGPIKAGTLMGQNHNDDYFYNDFFHGAFFRKRKASTNDNKTRKKTQLFDKAELFLKQSRLVGAYPHVRYATQYNLRNGTKEKYNVRRQHLKQKATRKNNYEHLDISEDEAN